MPIPEAYTLPIRYRAIKAAWRRRGSVADWFVARPESHTVAR
jgi:hypothetical protein